MHVYAYIYNSRMAKTTTVVASYSELYEEGEVAHINGVWPVFLLKLANSKLIGLSRAVGVVNHPYISRQSLLHVGLLSSSSLSISSYIKWEGLLICSTSPSSYNSE